MRWTLRFIKLLKIRLNRNIWTYYALANQTVEYDILLWLPSLCQIMLLAWSSSLKYEKQNIYIWFLRESFICFEWSHLISWFASHGFMRVIERKQELAGNEIICNLLHIDRPMKFSFGFHFSIWMHGWLFKTNSK